MVSLSVCTVCSNPISMEFPLRECLLSINAIADEIILIDGDDVETCSGLGEVNSIVSELPIEVINKMTVYHLPWRDSFRKNMASLTMSAAISQCTKDYVLWLDADELIHEEDHSSIRELMRIGKDAYSFRTLHFYKDYDHYKLHDSKWYNHRPKLFKNNLGIWDGYQSWIENGVIKREFTADLTTWDYEPVHSFSIKTKIPVYHYGWTRSTKAMTKKTNLIEKHYDPNFKDMEEFKWDMCNTAVFEGTHPKPIREKLSGA